MSASGADPVLLAADPAISNEVPVLVGGLILKDVSNLDNNETPESVAAGAILVNKTDASYGAVGPTASANEKENAPSHEQPVDGVFDEAIIHESDIALDKTEDGHEVPVVGVDNVAADTITADNVDDTTLNEKADDFIAVGDIPGTPEVESHVATAELGTPAHNDSITPVANTIDERGNVSASEILAQECTKSDEDTAPAVESAASPSSDHVESVVEEFEAFVETHEDDPKVVVEDTIEQTQSEDAPCVAEEQVSDVEIAPTEANLEENGAIAVTKTEIAVSPNDVGVTTEEVEQGQDEEAYVEPTSNVEAEPLVEVSHEVEPAAEDVSNIEHEETVRYPVEEEPKITEFFAQAIEEVPVTEKDAVVAVAETTEASEVVEEPTNDTEASISTLVGIESNTSEGNIVPEVEVTHEGRPLPEVEQVVPNETISVPVDEVLAIPEGEPVDAVAKSVAEVEGETSLEAVEGEPVHTSEEIIASIDANDSVHEVALEPESVLASQVITDPFIEREAVPIDNDIQTISPETNNEEGFAIEPVTVDDEVISVPVDGSITTDVKAGNEEVSVQVEIEPVAASIGEPITESEIPSEDVAACMEPQPLLANEPITTLVIESEEVGPHSDEIRAAALGTSAVTYDEPATIEIQHETENIAEANEETTASAMAEPETETEGVNEVEAVMQEAPESIKQEFIPASDEITAIIDVAEESGPVEFEGTFTAPVNVENEENCASVVALDQTTVVEVETASIEAPVEVTPEALPEAEHGIVGEGVSIIVAEDDLESSVPGEEITITSLEVEAAPQVDDETTHEVFAPAESESVNANGDFAKPTVQASDEVPPPSISTPDVCNDAAETQATHTDAPGEIAHDTESSTDIVEGEAVAEEMHAQTIQVESVADTEATRETVVPIEGNPMPTIEDGATRVEDALETTQEAPLETSFKSGPAPIVEVDDAGIAGNNQTKESVLYTGEGASVPIAPIVAEIATIEIVTEGTPVVYEEKERATSEFTKPQVNDNALVQDQEEETGIKDSTEVAPEDTSITLITSIEETLSAKACEPEEEEKTVIAENARPPADVSELVGEKANDVGSTNVPAPVTEEIVTATGHGDEVAVEDSTSSVVESDTVKENVPELRTSMISIETSLDTTLFTPVVDSGIEFKEQDSVSSKLSSIAEELEKPNPVCPSPLQAFTIGSGESSAVCDVGSVVESTELAETSEPTSIPLLVVEDIPVNKQVPTIVPSEDFISVDEPTLELPPRPWTPSYSVHSQGSPTRVELAEDFPSIDEPVPVHADLLAEQDELDRISVERGFKAEAINNNESSEQIIEDVTSTMPSIEDQASEPAPADRTEISEKVMGGLDVTGEEDANEDADQETGQEVEAKLTINDAPPRPWTPSYSTHSQGTPLVAMKELEDVPPASVITEIALSTKRDLENHVDNSVTVDSEHENTVDEQIDTTENEVDGQPSIEMPDIDPVIALEGRMIEDESLEPRHSSQAEADLDLENELPPRTWTPSYSVHSQGSPATVPKEVEAAPVDTEAIQQSIPESTIATPPSIGAHHSELITAEFDEGETPSSVGQSQNSNIDEVVAAAIAPTIALALSDSEIQGLVPVADEEASQADATLAIDTTTVPLVSAPLEVGDDTTDTVVDVQERPRSPWTLSYSVTNQDASLSREEAEADHPEPLLSGVTQAATASDSEPQLNEVQEGEPGPNALQTRQSYAISGTEDIAKKEQFFLFGLRAIVAYLWVLPRWLSLVPSGHERQESSSSSLSSSSKLFPGAWFTPKPKEARMSFDVAEGEFASSPKATTSNDVFETLGSGVSDPSTSANVATEYDGQKRKWCVVM